MDKIILGILFVLGAVMGSFACCQAWRWRYKIEGKKPLGKRSVCLHCHKQLKWYDNIPILSWVFLRGKCRYCKKKIGPAEIIAELGMAASFLMVGQAYLVPMAYYWETLKLNPVILVLKIITFLLILIMLVVLGILAVYDAMWGELPVTLLRVAVGMGFIIFLLKEVSLVFAGGDRALTVSLMGGIFGITGSDLFGVAATGWMGALWGLLSTLAGAAILAGVCFLIYKLSNERLMGGGDWILALAIALAVADWWLALWVMFLSNLFGDIVMMPSLLQKGNHKVHFGPFLALAFVLVLWLGNCLPMLVR